MDAVEVLWGIAARRFARYEELTPGGRNAVYRLEQRRYIEKSDVGSYYNITDDGWWRLIYGKAGWAHEGNV